MQKEEEEEWKRAQTQYESARCRYNRYGEGSKQEVKRLQEMARNTYQVYRQSVARCRVNIDPMVIEWFKGRGDTDIEEEEKEKEEEEEYVVGERVLLNLQTRSLVVHYFYSRNYEIVQCPSMIKRESVPSNLADWFEEATVKLDARHSKDMIVSGLQTALKMLENNLDRCLDTRRLCLIGEFVSKNKFGKPILRNSVELISIIYENYDSETMNFTADMETLLKEFGLGFDSKLIHPDRTHRLAEKQVELRSVETLKCFCTLQFHSDHLSKGIGLRAKISSQKLFPKIISCVLNLAAISSARKI